MQVINCNEGSGITHQLTCPRRAMYFIECLKAGYNTAAPPAEVLVAWKDAFGSVLRSKVYFELDQRLRLELADIQAVEDAKKFYSNLVNNLVLSSSIGFANFSARLIYDASGLSEQYDTYEQQAYDTAGSVLGRNLTAP